MLILKLIFPNINVVIKLKTNNILIYRILLAGTTLLSNGGPYFFNKENVSEDSFMQEYLKLDAYEIAALAHQPEDMFKHCSIRGNDSSEKCKELQIGHNKIFSPHQGVCYAFNMVAKDNLNQSFQIDNLGPPNGLALIIDVEGLEILLIQIDSSII